MVSGELAGLPAFVRLAGHGLRWQLLRELARSDRRVRELVAMIGEPQNLVSYHLGKLRSAGLVTMHRSSADGRDVYYHVDLNRCAESLAGAAEELHPGLRQHLVPQPPAPSPTRQTPRRVRVLFLCTGNSARSPMAAALLQHRAGEEVRSTSAGSRPKALHPHAVRALRDYYGIDLSVHRPQHLERFSTQRFHYVITLCDRVREVCPEFPHHPAYLHWSIPDPNASTSAGGVPSLAAFRRTAAELDTRIRFLIPALTVTPQGS